MFLTKKELKAVSFFFENVLQMYVIVVPEFYICQNLKRSSFWY